MEMNGGYEMSMSLALVSVALLVIAAVGYFDLKRYANKMNSDAPSEKDKKALIIRVIVFCSALVAVSVINMVSIIMRWL